ncbi:hypothetical protein [Streptomyces curacoi]|uniref:hypothetical protein n=1 Tax=Streptomyces curacoi TaxID=146536 RepID=UPI0031339B03
MRGDRARAAGALPGGRGPPGVPFGELTLPDGARLTVRREPDLLGGVTVVSADGLRRGDAAAARLTAVPYHAWANRRQGPMRVWIPQL